MTYDAQGRWTRTDRPELLSDRLGYPPERGDEDWPAIKKARNEEGSFLMSDNTCPSCGAQPNGPHDGGCDVARCLATGKRRMECPGRDHDCGLDVWTGP